MGARESFSIPEPPMTAKRRKSLRISAFHAQHGRCFYCGLPMWLAAPSELGLKPGKRAPSNAPPSTWSPSRTGPRCIRERGGRTCPMQPVQA